MRFSTLSVAVVLAVASPLVVSGKGTLGFSLGDKNPDSSCKSTSDYEADFTAIQSASGSTMVRIYAASDCNCAENILPAAKSKGFKVILGVWPDEPQSFNDDVGALKQYVPQYTDQVYAITVGSETLYRGNFTGEQLLDKINTVKKLFPNTKVGTADSWNRYADGTADPLVTGGVDILLVNAFAYWQASPISNATKTYFDDTMQAFGHIQSLSGGDGVELWTGETGWPGNGGSPYGAAQASTANEKTYWDSAVCGMLDWDVNVFYFEAFDETWKPASVGQNGQAENEQHWGSFTDQRVPKFPMSC